MVQVYRIRMDRRLSNRQFHGMSCYPFQLPDQRPVNFDFPLEQGIDGFLKPFEFHLFAGEVALDQSVPQSKVILLELVERCDAIGEIKIQMLLKIDRPLCMSILCSHSI